MAAVNFEIYKFKLQIALEIQFFDAQKMIHNVIRTSVTHSTTSCGSLFIDPKFEWKQCWSPCRIIKHHSGEPNARDISKFWKIGSMKQNFRAFHIFLLWKYIAWDWDCIQFVFGSGFEHKCGGFSQPWWVGGFQSSNAGRTCVRRVTWGLCFLSLRVTTLWCHLCIYNWTDNIA